MFQRQIVIPASPEKLWDALTDPEALSAWFGAEVEWDLHEGGAARFVDDEDGTLRRGVVESVLPGRHLRFVWWRDDDGAASQVSYVLEPDDEGTRLTVIEQPLSAPAAPVASVGGGSWTAWDDRLFRCWAQVGVGAATLLARR
jgi:uncharacterized protein YndB with AHSA1/START domain